MSVNLFYSVDQRLVIIFILLIFIVLICNVAYAMK